MGGDHAPREVVRGAVGGLEYLGPDDRIVLFGLEDAVRKELAEHGVDDHCAGIERVEPPSLSAALAPHAARMRDATGVHVIESGDAAMMTRAWLSGS